MKLLVLGGTVFLGRHVVAQALARGDEVTLLHRGRRGTGLFPAARTLIGDRDGDLSALAGQAFDAVIDCSGYTAAQLERSTAMLAAVPRYLFVSSISVGAAFPPGRPFDGLVPLYVISALFGLFQGGIVPSYAIIVREHFPAAEAGARVGTVLMCTLFGMALGGWMSGKVFDLTGSYQAAFVNGIGWNLLNLAIASTLLWRQRGAAGLAMPRRPNPSP